MKITILGAGTAIPAYGYSPSGIYLKAAGNHILMDAGPGTLQRLFGNGVTYRNLDRVFFTHYHPDHCLDIVSILFAMRIPKYPRTKPLTCYGPKGLKRLYRDLNRIYKGWIAPRGYKLNLNELGRAVKRIGKLTVRTEFMLHSTRVLGYRFEVKGKSVVYSGDTDVCPGIVRLAKNADVLILECSVRDEDKYEGHLTPSECGRIAEESGCKHLVLTHFYPVFKGYDIRRRVRKSFRAHLTLARDGTTLNL